MIGRAALTMVALLATGADEPLAGLTPGVVIACIDLGLTQNVQIIDRRTILYRETARRLWRTGPDGPCPDLEPSATLIAEVQGRQLCRGDRFRVRRQGISVPGGICRFTAFTPYDRR